MDDFKIEDEDLYEILEISAEATTAHIKKAYRKKALKCHPDKNPDNPDAAKLFHRLTKILEVLTDEPARRAYDKVLKGKKEAAVRHKELDSKRRKLKEDLEARERSAAAGYSRKSNDEMLREEIDRLRKEGSRLVQEEMEYIQRKLKEELQLQSRVATYRVKVKWKAAKHDPDNGGYGRENLHRFLSKYGDVNALVVGKKGGSALAEFKTQRAAEMAVDFEKGLAENPLQLEWVNGAPGASFGAGSTIKASDFESVVFTKMKQAEERKRLIEQMMAEDAAEED